MHDTAPPAFSRTFDLAQLADRPETITVTASPAECAAVAAAFALPAIASHGGKIRLSRMSNGRIAAQLDLSARLTQICVVTLDPFEQIVAERTALVIVPSARGETGPDDTLIADLDSPDEIIAGGTVIDLGALVTEQLALALDPYPRKSDAVLPALGTASGETAFASLAALKKPDPDKVPGENQD